MKKNESIIHISQKKVIRLKTFVGILICLLMVSQNEIFASPSSAPANKKNIDAVEKEEADDNAAGEDGEEEDVSPIADQDDNATEGEADSEEVVESENKKEQLNEIVKEEETTPTQEEPPAVEKMITPEPQQPAIVEEPRPLLESKPEENYVDVYTGPANVEVVTSHQYTNYKERRKRHGFSLGLSSENVYMPDYVSIYDGKLYEELWGQEDISMPQLSMSYKFNFILGSINLGASYAQGSILDDRSSDQRTIQLEKKAVNFQVLFDNLMSEPYFVPYAGVSVYDFKIKEHIKIAATGIEESQDFETEYGNAYTVGFLIQLNWLEKESAKHAYFENGLENTYLDIYWTQYENPNQDPDPNTQSDFNWGAGLRIEF